MFGLAPGIDGGEIIVILVVALIVVGPKDLPGLIRRVGKFMGRMRAMAGDFRASFDEMARQSELDDLRREIQEMKGIGPYAKDTLIGDANAVEADIKAELAKPVVAPRPFAPAEPVEADDAEVSEPVVAKPAAARASRPFAPAPLAPLAPSVEDVTAMETPIAAPAASGPFGIISSSPSAPEAPEAAPPVAPGPASLSAARPFAPAAPTPSPEPATDEPPLERRQA